MKGRPPWNPSNRHRDRTVLRLGRVLKVTGHRLGEICLGRGLELSYLTFDCISLKLSAQAQPIPCPSPEQLRRARPGDVIFIRPCASKTDQFGEKHCSFYSVAAFNVEGDSAADAIRDIILSLIHI